jgi:hypothetical protein
VNSAKTLLFAKSFLFSPFETTFPKATLNNTKAKQHVLREALFAGETNHEEEEEGKRREVKAGQ